MNSSPQRLSSIAAGGGGGMAPGGGATTGNAVERPRLLDAGPRFLPNVAIVSGFPWHYSESDAFRDFSAFGLPKTVRFYEEPLSGKSRGIALVEYENNTHLRELATKFTAVGSYPIVTVLYHLTLAHRWDRTGRLPDLPTDPPNFFGRGASGFGAQGFAVRGVQVAPPNTIATTEGVQKWREVKKRNRDTETA